jgi:hypothetical protein
MSLQLTIDTTAEKFGAAVTIAHLAANSFEGCTSERLHIYRCDAIIERDWAPETDTTEMEYGAYFAATFKDGSRLSVAAWGACCEEGDPHHGNCRWCGGRYDAADA